MDRSMAHRRRKNAGINARRLNPGGAISVIDGCSAVFCGKSAFGGQSAFNTLQVSGSYWRNNRSNKKIASSVIVVTVGSTRPSYIFAYENGGVSCRMPTAHLKDRFGSG